MRPTDELAAAALTEIVELHRFFAIWFLGRCANSRAAFARVTDALAPGFVRIDPAGRLQGRAAVLSALDAAHGCYAGEAFAIRVLRPRVSLIQPGLVLAIYEERQRRGGALTRRRASALLAQAPAAPRGVAWLHLQETWIDVSPG